MIIRGTKAFAAFCIAIRTGTAHGIVIAAMIIAVVFTCIVVQVVLFLASCGNTSTVYAILCGTVGHRIAVALCIIISAVLRVVQFAFIVIQIRNTGIAGCRFAFLVFACNICRIAQGGGAVRVVIAAMLNGIAFAPIVVEV